MKREGFNLIAICLVVAVGLSLYVGRLQAAVTLPPEAKALKRNYYKKTNTCENVEAFVRHQVELWYDEDKSITAKLFKLLYADCMVNGCDASILLDGPRSEKTSKQNSGLGGFILIDKIKSVVEQRCPGNVSCADILNLATRDAAHLAGAPSYPVLLGRRDGVDSNEAWVDLPLPNISWQQGLAYFRSKGLDQQDYATLLGAHTMGKTHCAYIHDRLYNFNKTGQPDRSMRRSTLVKLRTLCPKSPPKNEPERSVFLTDKNGDDYRFTSTYYSNVISHESVLRVDQQLLYNSNTTQLASEYAASREKFRREFALSISRMGSLKVLTGNRGEIRLNCRSRNNKY